VWFNAPPAWAMTKPSAPAPEERLPFGPAAAELDHAKAAPKGGAK